MGILSEWIRSMAACALVCALALIITPPGRVRNVTKTVCGLLMLVALVSPLTGGDGMSLSLDLAQYRAASEKISATAQEENANLSRTIIERELREYTLDKAASSGIPLTDAAFSMRWSEKGFWYPVEVSLQGEAGDMQKKELAQILETELGLAPEGQKWSENEPD